MDIPISRITPPPKGVIRSFFHNFVFSSVVINFPSKDFYATRFAGGE